LLDNQHLIRHRVLALMQQSLLLPCSGAGAAVLAVIAGAGRNRPR